jgi:hypothetical protein
MWRCTDVNMNGGHALYIRLHLFSVGPGKRVEVSPHIESLAYRATCRDNQSFEASSSLPGTNVAEHGA